MSFLVGLLSNGNPFIHIKQHQPLTFESNIPTSKCKPGNSIPRPILLIPLHLSLMLVFPSLLGPGEGFIHTSCGCVDV